MRLFVDGVLKAYKVYYYLFCCQLPTKLSHSCDKKCNRSLGSSASQVYEVSVFILSKSKYMSNISLLIYLHVGFQEVTEKASFHRSRREKWSRIHRSSSVLSRSSLCHHSFHFSLHSARLNSSNWNQNNKTRTLSEKN